MMLHKVKHKLFDGKKSKSRFPSTFINMLHSKSTYFYRWESKHLSGLSYVVPSVCSLALVLVLGIALFPTIDGSTTSAYAESGIAPMSVDQEGHISLELLGAADQVTTATADQVSYRINQFNVKYAQTSQYAVQVNSMNGYGSSLFGQQNPTAEIKGVGENKTPAQFGNNTWGYAIGEGESDGTNLTYNTVPEYNTQTKPLIKNYENGDLTVTDEEQTDSYTLAFAAKIGSDSPADHYISKVYLSVVRTPGRVYTITYNANKPADAAADVTGIPEEVKFLDTGEAGKTFVLSSISPKLKKYTFLGWSTEKLGAFPKTEKDAAKKAVQYPASGSIDLAKFTVPTDINLYAVWVEGGGLLDIDTMQQMTAEICSYSEVGDTKQLKDTRDDNKYWVAKLADNNCWMTQNLDYNIPADKKLSKDTSNVSSDITLDSVTKIDNSNSTSFNSWATTPSASNILAYYDPGLMLKTNPSTIDSCGEKTNLIKLNSNECISKGWLDVSAEYTPKATAPEGDTWSDTSATSNVIDETNKTYDAHYLSGNYYSWNLATAGLGQPEANAANNTNGTQISGSICPKGWKLPTSSNKLSNTLAAGDLDSFDISGSFAYLFRQYGLATGYNEGNVTTNDYNIYDAPLYYLRSGLVDYGADNHGFMGRAGNSGKYWSSVVASNVYAYYFSFSANTEFGSSLDHYRSLGLSIRCVHDPSIVEAD